MECVSHPQTDIYFYIASFSLTGLVSSVQHVLSSLVFVVFCVPRSMPVPWSGFGKAVHKLHYLNFKGRV